MIIIPNKLKSEFCKIIISPTVNDSGFLIRDFNVGIVQLSNSQTSYRFKLRRFNSALKCVSNIVFSVLMNGKSKK